MIAWLILVVVAVLFFVVGIFRPTWFSKNIPLIKRRLYNVYNHNLIILKNKQTFTQSGYNKVKGTPKTGKMKPYHAFMNPFFIRFPFFEINEFSPFQEGPTNISGHPSGDPPEAPHQLFEKAQNLIHFQGHGRMVLVQHSYPMFFYFRYVFLTLK